MIEIALQRCQFGTSHPFSSSSPSHSWSLLQGIAQALNYKSKKVKFHNISLFDFMITQEPKRQVN